MKQASFIFTILFLTASLLGCSAARANQVHVVENAGEYSLEVDGKPFYIQGVGTGHAFGQNGENYLKMAKALGANTVRTWGTDQGDQKYLDEAEAQGLYVDAGIWMNYADPKKGFSYLSAPEYLEKKEKEITEYVTHFKTHPAILMWNIGNEAISFTKSEEERVAFCKTLEKFIQKVHALDPDHPVIYASAGTGELEYLAKYVPSLDIVGVNSYGDPIMVEAKWKQLGFKKPYALTEFGPLGPWDLPKDANGRYIEEKDTTKAAQYRNHWNLLKERRGRNIGGFVFHLGETTQDSLVNWNINYHTFPREAFLVMQSLFKGTKIANHAPKIKSLTGVPSKAAASQVLDAEIKAQDPEGGPLTYEFVVSSALEGVLQYYVNEPIAVKITPDGPKASIEAPSKPGFYRVYGIAYDDAGNAAVTNVSLKVE